MLRNAAPLAFLALALLPGAARADGGAYGLFVAGQSEGEPSTAKQVTTYSLYGASLLSLGASAYFFVEWQSLEAQRADFNIAEPSACVEFTSAACARASDFDRDVNRSLGLGFGAVATGVTLAVSGVLVAQYWPNLALEPSLAVLPGGGFASTTLRF